jgi:F-type H+-transporting ATPase subunit delta
LRRRLPRLRGLANYVRNRADFTRPGGLEEAACAPEIPHGNEVSRPSQAPWAGALIGDWVSVASETTGSSGLAERYAAALFELADERHGLDAVAGDLRQLRTMVTASPDLVRLLRSPVLSREEQGKAVEALAERAGLSELTRNFLGVVAGNRRLFAVPDMIEAYLKQLAERRGEVTAEVMVAQPLNETRRNALTEQLRRALGARVAVDVRVDPSLLGGMIVKVGSRMVDASLASRLQRLRLAMRASG